MLKVVELLRDGGTISQPAELFGVGHRVVHGGEAFRQPALVDGEVVEAIRAMTPLAPLHNPANLIGIEVARRRAPQVPQVAVFDTAFHQGMPDHAFRYAVPEQLYRQHGVRRYGFHGTSHAYVAREGARLLGRPLESLNLITLHLGNGASAAAIEGGRSVDTSMGLTPLEGLIMGTRCGDLDPALHFYIARATGASMDDIECLLNRDSGLRGICGDNDMRTIRARAAQGDEAAALALRMFAYRLRKYIGAYCAVLGHVDALIFTGGIGENDAAARAGACESLEMLGIRVDPERNRAGHREAREIQAAESSVRVLVVPTDEELEIARQTVATIRAGRGS
jgi:acetate kinase